MILYIYLGISLVTLILLILTNLSGVHNIKRKYGDKLPKDQNQDIAGIILSWIKLIFISFIPLYNILMLLLLIFKPELFSDKAEEVIKNAIEKEMKK